MLITWLIRYNWIYWNKINVFHLLYRNVLGYINTSLFDCSYRKRHLFYFVTVSILLFDKILKNVSCWVGWADRILWLPLCRGFRHLTATRLSFCGRWPIMLKDGILMAVLSVTWEPEWSRDMQHFTFVLTGLDGRSKMPDPINPSNLCTNMVAPTIFFKLVFWQKKYSTLFHGSLLMAGTKVQMHWVSNTWNHLNCVQSID